MSRSVRLALVALGLALTAYGVASLTGGWLGTPPWWEREMTHAETEAAITEAYVQLKKGYEESNHLYLRASGSRLVTVQPTASTPDSVPAAPVSVEPRPPTRPTEGREWISAAVIAMGLGLVAWGAWPRRRGVAA